MQLVNNASNTSLPKTDPRDWKHRVGLSGPLGAAALCSAPLRPTCFPTASFFFRRNENVLWHGGGSVLTVGQTAVKALGVRLTFGKRLSRVGRGSRGNSDRLALSLTLSPYSLPPSQQQYWGFRKKTAAFSLLSVFILKGRLGFISSSAHSGILTHRGWVDLIWSSELILDEKIGCLYHQNGW